MKKGFTCSNVSKTAINIRGGGHDEKEYKTMASVNYPNWLVFRLVQGI